MKKTSIVAFPIVLTFLSAIAFMVTSVFYFQALQLMNTPAESAQEGVGAAFGVLFSILFFLVAACVTAVLSVISLVLSIRMKSYIKEGTLLVRKTVDVALTIMIILLIVILVSTLAYLFYLFVIRR